jgi:aminoglycoside phosphotransferase (APT) family kinase protein
MGVRDEFAEQNFFRETHCVNRARKVAHMLGAILPDAFPEIFKEAPTVTALRNQGWMNLTVLVESADGYSAYILRLAERSQRGANTSHSLPHFEKERYVLERLQRFEFIPRVISPSTGVLQLSVPGEGEREYAYLLQSYLPYRPGSAREITRDRGYVLEQLGARLAEVHSVAVEGFGSDFSERHGRFAFETFEEYIAHRIRSVEESPIDSSMKRWLTARVRGLMELRPEPRLYHRDLLGNWGNFLVDGDSCVRGIIDWEFAGSGAPLQSELASMIYVLHRDGAPQEQVNHDIAAVLKGYGISHATYCADYERDTETLVLLHSVAALAKFEAATREGSLEREPWRSVFAARARKMCADSFAIDGVVPRVGRLAA